ncbi:MAG: hypothetical protein QME42_05545 [bacterium]|nr:hypothetical protein [bacterium]
MRNTMIFGEVLESADRLSLKVQETMIDVWRRRIIENEHQRAKLIKEIQECKECKCKLTTPSELKGNLSREK